jgi:SAF domain.
MLLEIAKLPTAENSAIHLNPTDNVAVARVPLAPGMQLRIDGAPLTVLDHVPAGHKVALTPIAQGEIVRRYGQVIGRAKRDRSSPAAISIRKTWRSRNSS